MSKHISFLGPDLDGFAAALKNKIVEILPKIIAVEGQKHFEESFDSQGFINKGISKWKRRKFGGKKDLKNGKQSKAYREFQRKDQGRAILVSHQADTKGTHLKDSIRNTHTSEHVTFTTDKEYAQVHNEGGKAGRGQGFEMPQRQFMGPSADLDEKINNKMKHEIDKFFRDFKI